MTHEPPTRFTNRGRSVGFLKIVWIPVYATGTLAEETGNPCVPVCSVSSGSWLALRPCWLILGSALLTIRPGPFFNLSQRTRGPSSVCLHKALSSTRCYHLYVLWVKSNFLPSQQPAPEVLHWGKLHFLSVFTVNIQEDAKDHQKAAPNVPEEGETQLIDRRNTTSLLY